MERDSRKEGKEVYDEAMDDDPLRDSSERRWREARRETKERRRYDNLYDFSRKLALHRRFSNALITKSLLTDAFKTVRRSWKLLRL